MNEIIERNIDIIATEIKSIQAQTQKIVLMNAYEIGKRLIEAKESLPHGEWGSWLEKTVEYSQRTANNLMKIYQEYGPHLTSSHPESQESQSIAKLNYTKAIELLSVPGEERGEFLKNNDVENMSTRELKQALKEKSDLEKQLVKSEKLQKNALEEKKESIQKYKDLQIENHSQNQQILQLKKEIEFAQGNNDPKELNQLNESLRNAEKSLLESDQKIKQLEKQLKEKPIDVPAVIEVIPENVELELQNLRRMNELNSEDAMQMKFRYSFENIAEECNKLLDILSSIQDEKAAGKLKLAFKNMIANIDDKL